MRAYQIILQKRLLEGETNPADGLCSIKIDGSDNLKKLEIGDTFYIIDKENSAKVTYKIYEKKTISPTDLSCLNQDTNNKREVTLITCNTRRIDKTYAKSKRGIEFHLKN